MHPSSAVATRALRGEHSVAAVSDVSKSRKKFTASGRFGKRKKGRFLYGFHHPKGGRKRLLDYGFVSRKSRPVSPDSCFFCRTRIQVSCGALSSCLHYCSRSTVWFEWLFPATLAERDARLCATWLFGAAIPRRRRRRNRCVAEGLKKNVGPKFCFWALF